MTDRTLLESKVSAWAEAIALEFDAICYSLNIELAKPFFQISSDFEGKWGFWDSRTNALFLNKDKNIEQLPLPLRITWRTFPAAANASCNILN